MSVKPEDLQEISTKPCSPISSESGKSTVINALKTVASVYGIEIAEWVERVWRKETGNFKYGFTTTCGAGMHPWSKKYPWGWKDAKSLWDEKPDLRPCGYRVLKEGGTGLMRYYLVFPDPTAFAMTLAYIIYKRKGKYNGDILYAVGSWYSKDKVQAYKYANDAKKYFKAEFVGQLRQIS